MRQSEKSVSLGNYIGNSIDLVGAGKLHIVQIRGRQIHACDFSCQPFCCRLEVYRDPLLSENCPLRTNVVISIGTSGIGSKSIVETGTLDRDELIIICLKSPDIEEPCCKVQPG